jgi:hypothetical protein
LIIDANRTASVHEVSCVKRDYSAAIVHAMTARDVPEWITMPGTSDKIVFERPCTPRLALIACGGPYNPRGGYRDNFAATAVTA